MNALVVWEWIWNIGGLLLGFQALRGGSFFRFGGPLFRPVNIWTVLSVLIVYLFTMLLFGCISWGNDLNYSSDSSLTDPWNPFWSWLPMMHWWMWIPFIVAALTLISPKLSILTRLIMIVLYVVTIFGAQWNDPFRNDDTPVVQTADPCPDLVGRYDAKWSDRDVIFHRQRDSTKVTDQTNDDATAVQGLTLDLGKLQEQISQNSCPVALPVIGFTKDPVITGLHVHVEPSVTGKWLEYEWNVGARYVADNVHTTDPVLDYDYKEPGTYAIILTVTDRFNRPVANSLTITIPDPQAESTTPSADSTVTTTAAAGCASTSWKMVPVASDNTLLPNGDPKILEASNPETARDAALDWVEQIKTDPLALSGAIRFFLQDGTEPSALLSDDGLCASSKATERVSSLRGVLLKSVITATPAPESGRPTGVVDGIINQLGTTGLSGDLRSLKVITPNGYTVYILGSTGSMALS